MEETRSKLKSKKTSFSISPNTGNKYKNFLTSILSPSVSKRRSKKSEKSLQFEEQLSSSSARSKFMEEKSKSDSIYSSIEYPVHPISGSFETESCGVSETEPKSRMEQNLTTEPLIQGPKTLEEPLYATIHKDDKRLLKERLKELAEENRLLRKEMQDILKDEKRKEETLHAELQLKILQFETDTRKEVSSLKARIEILGKEKETLNEQVDILVREKKELQSFKDTMVDRRHHKNMLEEYRKTLDKANARYDEKMKVLKKELESSDEKIASLTAKVSDMSEKIIASNSKCEELKTENFRLIQENEELRLQVEESMHFEQEAQKLILSLLKVTESVAVERDVLLDKASFQDSQQRALQTTVVDYSLNIGRLQEHISNLSKENVEEFQKKNFNRANEAYEKQIDILRQKILYQNNTINQLENGKRELEAQLKSILEVKIGCNQH